MSSAEVMRRPGFWAPAGWALANTNRLAEARRFAEAILAHRQSTDLDRHEADIILATVAAHTDDYRSWQMLSHRWPEPPPCAPASNTMIHAVSMAHHVIVSGAPHSARLILGSPVVETVQQSLPAPVSLGFADAFLGLSYLWEGKPLIAVDILRRGLALVEEQMDRRSRVAATLAAFLAEAELACGEPAEAARRLAHRSLQVNREGLPDAVISSCLTLAEIAGIEGRQDKALDRLTSLLAEGVNRGSHRMQAAAHFGLARLHAHHNRLHSAAREAYQASAVWGSLAHDAPAPIRDYCELAAALACATVESQANGSERLSMAEKAASRAVELAHRLHRDAETARALFLRAKVRRRRSDPASLADEAEAVSLCRAGGLTRLQREFSAAEAEDSTQQQYSAPSAISPSPKPAVYTGTLLTPREYEVACHLATHMTNKEIAIAIGLREETVKWHVKNLLQKLCASDRKSVVRRARMLGII
jgi:LuxR family maltose regulon positive regulatory protein